ncbi:MAG: hypothetical protein KBF08_00295 [Kiritimatiellae bacterium]|jgi:hypothetical protein|nr:hypothetical protein [Kiritimatiellia bacterium]MBP9571482.1 hypothetical protein [Kiritimatiellia bacterium]
MSERIYGRVETLVSYARGLSQDMSKSLAEFIAPTVVTGIASGKYKDFSDKNAFKVPVTRRAVGGKASRIGFESEDKDFNCEPNALEATIDDFERLQAGTDQAMLEEAKTRDAVSTARLSHEKETFDLVRASVPAVAERGVWSSNDNDPIDELDEQIEAIALATGLMPNRMVIGLSAFRKLRKNTKVIGRMPGAANATLSIEALAAMLINPGIDIRVGSLAYDTAAAGKTKSNAFVVGADVFLFYASQNATQYDPSFAKTFSARAGNIFDVRMYREEPRVDVIAVDWTKQTKVVSALCGRRLSIT